MKHLRVLLLLLITGATSAQAQNADCKILLDSLKGTYEGGCKNGKADGPGKATGAHVYDGDFKNGLPEGKGKYTWPNGDYYYGGWKKGFKEGKGELHLPVNDKDSVIYGYWSKGVYKGKYEKPYIIHNTSSSIGRVEVSKMESTNANITIEVLSSVGAGSVSGTSPTGTSGVAAASTTAMASLTEIRVQTGTYNTKVVTKLSNKEINVLQNVIFPFKAIFVFGNNTVELEIFEAAEWSVVVPIQRQ